MNDYGVGPRHRSDFAVAVLEHLPALRKYALSLAKSADGANDLVQDCVERALSKQHLYQPGTNLPAWLNTIMRNIFIVELRRTNLRRHYARDLLETKKWETLPNQFNRVLARESLALMAQLSATERQAVALVGLLDLPYPEAAVLTGLPVGTLKSRSSRGRASLRHLAERCSSTRRGVAFSELNITTRTED